MLLYGGEIWSLRYLNEIEKIQTVFFRHCLGLSHDVSNTLVRIETHQQKLIAPVLNRAINFIRRITKMNAERYPSIILLKLIDMDKENPNVTYNWVSQLKQVTHQVNIPINDVLLLPSLQSEFMDRMQ